MHLARGLRAKGYDPVFILARRAGDLLLAVQKEFPIIALNGTGYTPRGIFRSVPDLVRVLRTEKPDVLISGLPLINAAAALALFFGRARPKLITVEHLRHATGLLNGCWIKQWIRKQMVLTAHRMSDHIVCVSQTVLCDIDTLYAPAPSPKMHLIHNPIIPDNLEELCRAVTDHPWIHQTGQRQESLIVSVGRLLANKDYPTLLRAFHKVHEQNKATRLILLGEGDERENLTTLIKSLNLQNAVSMPGSVQNIFPYLKEASLFVLPSRCEAFGNVLVEALACGTNVVSTDCGGPREILEDGRFGRLVQVDDVEAMARAINLGLTEPVDRNKLAKHGGSFSVEKATEAYISLIES